MAENGILDYQGMNQAIYRGATSNIIVDTQSMSIEIGAGNSSHTSNLHFECNHDANVASIKLNSNVVTEFSRSKKLIKYPRVAMTGAVTSGYVADASNEDTNYGLYYAWKAFDNVPNSVITVGWYSGDVATYDGTNGVYNGSTRLASETELGEWLSLELPSSIKPQYMKIFSQDNNTVTNNPDNVILYAKNNSSDTWTYIKEYTGISAKQSSSGVKLDIDSLENYKYFAVVITKRSSSSATSGITIRELELYGVPEYDPEAYGTDVVVKSVPNVPNTDFLDVFVDAGNTSGYVLGSGSSVTSVTDLSLPANTMYVTGVTYDSTNKAFVFSGSSSSYIKATLQNGNGNYAHTLSAWFMMTDYSGNWRSIIGLGTNTPSGQQSAIAYNPDQDQLYFGTYGADIYVPHKPELYKWYHVVATFSGGSTTSTSMNIYLNGVNMGGVPDGTQTPSFTGDQLCIGGTMNSNGVDANNPFKGQIANARFYRRAYTSDEIYQLYAYQKEYFGHGDLSMTLKAGRLGIGTSEPRAALDVRGDMYGGCPVFFTAYAGNNGTVSGPGSTGSTVIIFNKTTVNKGGAYDTSNGRFTAPINGYYEVFFRGSTASTDNFHLQMYRNDNAPSAWRDHLPRLWDASDSTYRNAGTIQFFDYFDAGEYLDVRMVGSGVFNADNYNSFSVKYLSN